MALTGTGRAVGFHGARRLQRANAMRSAQWLSLVLLFAACSSTEPDGDSGSGSGSGSGSTTDSDGGGAWESTSASMAGGVSVIGAAHVGSCREICDGYSSGDSLTLQLQGELGTTAVVRWIEWSVPGESGVPIYGTVSQEVVFETSTEAEVTLLNSGGGECNALDYSWDAEGSFTVSIDDEEVEISATSTADTVTGDYEC